MMHEMESLAVHITGSDVPLTAPVKTEETEPEHFVIYTRVIPPFSPTSEPGGEGGQISGEWYAQILGQDPKRKSAAIYFPDGPAILCHSEAQASDSSNLAAGTPFPQGGYFPQNSSMGVDGTGPLWVVNPGNSTVRVTIVTNRRGMQ